MIYFKANNTERPATFDGKRRDEKWDYRESKAITLEATYAEAMQLFVDGLNWGIVQRDIVPVYDAEGNPTGETTEQVQEWDNSDFCVAGPITDNRDGTITAKMGKRTADDILAELEEAYDGE